MINTRITDSTTNSTNSRQQKLGKYTLLNGNKPIGKGAFSTVYLAEDQQSNYYAIKKISKSQTQSHCLARAQANILNQLDHQHIAKYHNSFQSDNNFYLVTTYYPGKNLRQHINQWKFSKKPALPEILQIIGQLIKTLKYLLLEHHIIHRDLKPDNIIYTLGGKIVLVDFGFAAKIQLKHHPEKHKIQDRKSLNKHKKLSSKIGKFVGTTKYMSPQILTQHQQIMTGKQDIWSLGVLMYELVSYGRHPWHGTNNEKQLYSKIIKQGLKFPYKIPPYMKKLIEGCLTVDPKQRMSWLQVFEYGKYINKKYEYNTEETLSMKKEQQAFQTKCCLFGGFNNSNKIIVDKSRKG